MANTSAPFGFKHFGNAGGVTPNFELITLKIASGDSTAAYRGDPLKRLSTGYVSQWSAGTAVSQLAGIFESCTYLSVSQGKKVWSPYWPGSDASGDVTVYAVPVQSGAKFIVQVSGASPVAFAEIGQNIDVALGTGNTRTGQSGATANYATLGTTSTLPFVVVDQWSNWTVSGLNGTDDTTAYNVIIVQANFTSRTGI